MPNTVDDGGDRAALIRRAWQAVACPEEVALYPAEPGTSTTATDWWHPLPEVLMFGLGWTWPGLGLGAWRRQGYPATDPVLRFVLQTWGSGLEVFEHWLGAQSELWPLPGHLMAETQKWQDGQQGAAETHKAWLNDFFDGSTRPSSVQWMNPTSSGGSFPAWYLVDALSADDPEGWASYEPSNGRHGTLMMPRYGGWYWLVQRQLRELGPRTDGRRWRIDAVVRTVGWMGAYRISDVTGRAFRGEHKWHMLGQADAVAT